jgi:O-antigen/teichoic acid export membrane protein
LYAIFGSFLASYLVGIGYLWWHANEHFRIAFDFSQLKKLIPIGLPLDVGGAADTLMNTAGSMVILLFLSTTELGYYGIGGTFIGLLMQFPSSLAWVLNPRLLERYGKTEDVRELWNHAVTPTVFVAYLLPILMAEAALAMAMVIRYLLPAYMPGVPAITILLFGNFFYALVYPTANLMVALNRQLAATVVRVGSALLNVAFIYAFLSIGLRLKGVALGTSCAYFVLGTTLTVLMMRYYFSSMKAIVRFLAGMYAPFGYMVALFIATGYLLPADATLGATKFVGVIALRGIVLAAAYAPILLHASRKPQFAELARQVAGSKLGSYLSWCSKRPTGSHR